MGLKILKTSSIKAKKEVHNSYFESIVETSDDWIKTRTGIKSRYFTNEEHASDMAIEVSKNLQSELKDIKLIIVASFTPDLILPSIAAKIQLELGLSESVFCTDINMACTGFVGAMILAQKYLNLGERALIVATEEISKVLDFEDRSSCVLFGDGAGGAVVEKSEAFFVSDIKTFGNIFDLYMKQGEKLKMEGKNVYRFAVDKVPESIKTVIEHKKLSPNDIDHVFSHQANIRILEKIAKKTKIDLEKFYINLDRFGNTSAASIPILLDEKYCSINKGDKVLFTAFGAGLSVASLILEWE